MSEPVEDLCAHRLPLLVSAYRYQLFSRSRGVNIPVDGYNANTIHRYVE
jgi:hypothetical protein